MTSIPEDAGKRNAKGISEALDARKNEVIAYLLPNAVKKGHEYEVGSLAGEPGHSLKVHANGKGSVWSDFATGDRGGDLLDLWKDVRCGGDMKSAMREAADWLGLGKKERTARPLGKHTASWTYRHANGDPYYEIRRYDFDDGKKEFRPYNLTTKEWKFPKPRILYDLHALSDPELIDGVVNFFEGEKCCEAAKSKGLPLCTTTPGGAGSPHCSDFGPLHGRDVYIFPDNDEAGQRYAEAVAKLCLAVGVQPFICPVPENKPLGWDIADAVAEGWTLDEIEHLREQAQPYNQMGEDEDEEASGLPEIQISTDIKGMVDAAEQALLDLPGPVLYQRAKLICRIAPAGESPKWLQRPPDAPVISRADTHSLREYSGQSAQWVKYDKRGKEWSPALPPTFIFETLASRVSWKFPKLEGIICAPTLRSDGVLISKPGFDKETGLYLDFNGVAFPPVPESPTQADAKAALDILYAPFADFPFKEECHRSAALAGVLTLVGRFTVAGCVPAFGVRAHAKGTGKGLLVNTIAMIGTGRTAPTWTQTLDEAEEAKRLLTIALAGDACMHIDNITQRFGSAKLNSAITSQTVKDRLLGVNNSQEAPWLTVIFASGNNMTFEGDMVRRVIPIDLDPQVEHPEERSGFRHTPLLDWVKAERPKLVVAALTVLKAFFHAGCPKQENVSELGSFEQWSDLIRHSLIWAGFPDPCEGRRNLEEESDVSYEALATLLQCWADCYSDNQARSLKVITQDIERRQTPEPSAITPANEWNALHDALSAYDSKYDGKRLDTKRIGNDLRNIEGRVLDNQRLIRSGEDKHAKVAMWKREIIT